MRPWLKRTFIGVFGASALLGGMTACSHQSERHAWRSASDEDVSKFKSRAVERISAKLKLDTAQQAKLNVLVDRLQEQRNALHGASDPHKDLAALVSDTTFDRWHAQDLINAKLAAVRDKSPLIVAAMGDFYDSLNPEQQKTVREFMQHGPGWGWH
jgi:Spy/CpxP family protein refolding chaperone